MSIAEIVKAAKELPPTELTALTAELVRMDNAAWDDQIDDDAASGKLDRLFEEAEQERSSGTLRPWPEDSDRKLPLGVGSSMPHCPHTFRS